MNIFRILLAEIGYRKLNFLLSLVAVTVAVMLFVAGPTLVEGYSQATEAQLSQLQERVADSADKLKAAEDEAAAELFELEDETRRIMRDMGFNLSVLNRNADTVEFLASGRVTEDMSQDWVHTLASDPGLTMVTHLVATLKGEIEFGGRTVRLVGYLPEVPQSHKPQTAFAKKWGQKKTPMGYDIKAGKVQLGYALGEGREVGDTIELGGQTFEIVNILPEKGSAEDVTAAVHLSDAQALLDKPGTINEIKALECRCTAADLPKIRKQIGAALPEALVIRDTSKADARAAQRAMVKQKHDALIARHKQALEERTQALEHTRERREKIQSLMGTLARVVTPLVVLVSAIWVGLLALANVRERRVEIGILRAIGKGSGAIGVLFLGKALVMGLLGAAVGLGIGVLLARLVGTAALGVVPEQVTARPEVLLAAILGAPLLAVVASWLPTLSAVNQDPAVVLRDQ